MCSSVLLGHAVERSEMSAPLLATRLHIPPLCPKLVPRPRLIERLNVALPRQNASVSEGRIARKPMLISVPGGFARTMLVKVVWSDVD